jgi:hypothetical protein
MNKIDKDEYWENDEIQYVEACSKSPKEIDVYISDLVKYKIDILMKKFPSLEWLAYITGTINDNSYIVKDLYIPKQVVTGVDVHVDSSDTITTPIIGILHSHHNMSLRFSGIDHDGVNKNHDVSLLVTHKGMIGQVRTITECGSYIIVPANIKPYFEVSMNDDKFQTELDEKISEIKQHYPVNTIPMDSMSKYLQDRVNKRNNSRKLDIDEIDAMIESYKSRNRTVMDDESFGNIIDFDTELDLEDDLYYKEYTEYDDLDNTELYAMGKVRTYAGYRDMTAQEHSVLEIMGEGTPEFIDYLDEINEERVFL